jgi:DUF1680 family protein
MFRFIPSQMAWKWEGEEVQVTLQQGNLTSSAQTFILELTCPRPLEFTLRIRLPGWLSGRPAVSISGQPVDVPASSSSHLQINRTWAGQQSIRVEFPKGLTTLSLPDAPEVVAFLDGPLVLAGLCEEERLLEGNPARPDSILCQVHELEWYRSKRGYRTRVSPHGLRFIPLYEIRDEPYTVYFPVSASR